MESEVTNANSSFSQAHPFFKLQTDWTSIFEQNFVILIVTIFAVVLICRLFAGYYSISRGLNARRVLFVTAHPDDECMFFGPALVQLSRSASVHLLCLSPGNFYGQGSTRKRELWDSCRSLGVSPSNVTLVKHTLLPDDPKLFWPVFTVASLIDHHVDSLGIDTVVTFDRYGVSGHKNHISIYRALFKLNGEYNLYSVQTVSLFRKYMGFLSIFFNLRTPEIIYISSSHDRSVIRQAMTKHTSQYVWFRQLYMTFSCYIYFNSLTRIRR